MKQKREKVEGGKMEGRKRGGGKLCVGRGVADKLERGGGGRRGGFKGARGEKKRQKRTASSFVPASQ